MRFRLRLWVALMCGLIGVAAGPPALAETVQFTTSFQFTSGSGAGTNTAQIGSATFQLLGIADTVITPEYDIPFGSIVFNRNGQNDLEGELHNFVLTVTQIAPPGVGSNSYTFLGMASWLGGTVKLDFQGAPITIGNFTYTPRDLKASFPGDTGTATIRGDVESVADAAVAPLPAAAWGGMALCGLVAALKLRRKTTAEI